MGHRLHIKYDGDVAGLAEHRLSLGAFGEALPRLVSAVRRCVSNRLVETEDADHGTKGGAFAKLAKAVDVQIAELREGSLELTLEVDVLEGQLDMLAIEGGLTDFVDAIRTESVSPQPKGVARGYLQALPSGLQTHTYRAAYNDRVYASATAGAPAAAPDDRDGVGPLLVDIDATVRGVDFDKPSVRLQTDVGKVKLSATPALVEQAIALRDQTVHVRYLPRAKRLLALRPAGAERTRPDFEDAADAVFDRWDEVLRRLAK